MSTYTPTPAHQRFLAATRRPLFVFHWYGWRRFGRDLAITQVGFVLVALWFSLLRQVGVDDLIPWGIVEHAVADKLSIGVGFAYIIVNIAAVALALLVRETYGWASIAAFVLITILWADLMEAVVPDLHTNSLAAQLGWVVLAVPIGALGVAIYMSVNAGAGPRDNLMLWIARVLHTNVGVARVVLEVGLIGIGLALGGSAGWVTLTHVAVAGPAIWLAFRLFKIAPRHELWGRPLTQ